MVKHLEDWLRNHGFNFSELLLDGKIHRIDRGEKKDKSAWYIGSPHILPNGKEFYTLTAGDKRTDEKFVYKPNGELNEKDRELLQKKKQEDAKKFQDEKELSQEWAAQEAEKIWEGSSSSSETVHEYLTRKHISPTGASIRFSNRDGKYALLIPMRDSGGKLWGIQSIYEDGSKRFLKGQRKQGCYFQIGGDSGIQPNDKIVICEGFATGESIHQATAIATVVAFDCGNLIHVAREIRKQYPSASIVICADNDRFSEKNIGKEKAIESASAIDGTVVIPEFGEVEGRLTDFNDLHCTLGLEEVKRQILSRPRSEIHVDDTPIKKETNIFPVEALGPLLSEATRIIAEKVSAPVEIVCSSMLAAASVCVQPFFNIKAFGSIRPISLYFITIAKSGERKSTVDKIVLKEHYKWREEKDKIYIEEKTKYKERLEEWKSDQSKKDGFFKTTKPIAPKAPVLFVSEPTVEGLFFCLKHHRDSVGLFSDEGGSFLGGFAMKPENAKATVAKLNQLWDGSPIDRIRKGRDDGEIDILYNKRVSMHLMAQPKIAFELFNNEYAKSQGFLARCLTCHPKSIIGGRKFLYVIEPPTEMEKFYQRVRYFLDRGPCQEPKVINLNNGALRLIEEFYYETEAHQKDGGAFAGIADFASKAVEHCIRIAAVLESFHDEDVSEIGEGAMERAISIIPFFLNSQLKNTESATIFPSKDAEVIYEWIAKRKEWHIRDLLRMVPTRFRKKEILMRVIVELLDGEFCHLDTERNIVAIGATKW